MSQEGVKKLIGRMISDDHFKASFHQNPAAAIAASGYSLTPQEVAAVSKLKASDLAVKMTHGAGPVASYEIDVRSAKV